MLDVISSGRGRIALVVGAGKMTGVPAARAGDILLSASFREEEAASAKGALPKRSEGG